MLLLQGTLEGSTRGSPHNGVVYPLPAMTPIHPQVQHMHPGLSNSLFLWMKEVFLLPHRRGVVDSGTRSMYPSQLAGVPGVGCPRGVLARVHVGVEKREGMSLREGQPTPGRIQR